MLTTNWPSQQLPLQILRIYDGWIQCVDGVPAYLRAVQSSYGGSWCTPGSANVFLSARNLRFCAHDDRLILEDLNDVDSNCHVPTEDKGHIEQQCVDSNYTMCIIHWKCMKYGL